MLLSIVIPVYKDFERLEICIKAIDKQAVDRHLVEIVIVNNDSNEELPGALIAKTPIKILNCKREGSYAARNKGARIAAGSYLVFTDSDCIPDDEWLVNIERIISDNPSLDLISGHVELYPEYSKLPNPFEVYDMILGINQRAYAKEKKSVTANLIIKKESFIKLGGFDESSFSGGDHELCVRANRQGFKFKYFPRLVVYHPARNCMSQVVNKAKRRIGGRVGATGNKKMKAIVITLLPPFVRLCKIIKADDFSWRDKIKAAKVLFIVKFIQIAEVFKVVFFNKKKLR